MREEEYVKYFEESRKPLPGALLFDALTPPKEIVLAVNPRVTQAVVEGILKAAKDTGQILIFELALSEMSMEGGYTGLTPSAFSERVRRAAGEVGWYGYVLHADHMTVKKGTEEELDRVKRELNARVKAGFTSYAIDTSFLFDRSKTEVADQLREIIRTSIDLFHYLDERLGRFPYGKEGEVGEIGIREFTTVEEALYFLKALKSENIELNCLAIANGTKHGVSVDAEGNIIPQLGVNIKRTMEIAEAIRAEGYKTGIAQHGITGTPIHLIAEKFPKGMINKGNVGTLWMLLVWDILRIFEPQLYQKIYNWTLDKYKKEDVSDTETFTKNSKYAIKIFFNNLENVSTDTKRAIKAKAYAEALSILKAFGMEKTAEKVYNYLKKENITY